MLSDTSERSCQRDSITTKTETRNATSFPIADSTVYFKNIRMEKFARENSRKQKDSFVKWLRHNKWRSARALVHEGLPPSHTQLITTEIAHMCCVESQKKVCEAHPRPRKVKWHNHANREAYERTALGIRCHIFSSPERLGK